MRQLFILRPEPGASATAARGREMGLSLVVAPLFRIEAVAWAAPDPAGFDALLLTSANAVAHAGDELRALRGLPVHAVGDATAQAARAAGFDVASSGDAGVDRLLGSLGPGLRLLHVCGEDRRPPRNPRQAIHAVTAYRSVELPAPGRLKQLGGEVAAIHSPRAAERLAALAEELGLDRSSIRLACLSDAARDAAGAGWEAAEAAQDPSDHALLAVAARLCDKPRRS